MNSLSVKKIQSKPQYSASHIKEVVDAERYIEESKKQIASVSNMLKNHLIKNMEAEIRMSSEILKMLPNAFERLSKLWINQEIKFSVPIPIVIMSYNEEALSIEYEQLYINRIDFSKYDWDPLSLRIFYINDDWAQNMSVLGKLMKLMDTTSAISLVSNITDVVEVVKKSVEKNWNILNEWSINYEPIVSY